jgi:hypothetical protein
VSAPVTFSWESDWEKAPVLFQHRIVQCPHCGGYRYESFSGQPHAVRWDMSAKVARLVDCVGREVPPRERKP